MNPQSMQFAMEQMRRMSPDQLSSLAQQMNNLNPDTIQAAMSQMQNMRPEDWEQARQKMSSMRPEDLSSAATQASSHYQAQQEYIVKASVQLKNEGNSLHQQSQYAEAIPKYEKALSNLAEYKSQAALDVVKACCLNLGSCFLQLGRYKECVEKCNAVLAGDSDNLKALYRRGQALLHMGKGQEAVDDLQRAVKLSSHDPNQQSLIKAKLQEAKDLAWQQRVDGDKASADDAAMEEVDGVIIEEVDDDEPTTIPAATSDARPSTTTTSSSSNPTPATNPTTPPPSAGTFPMGMPAGLDPSMVNQAVQMMKSNPELLKQVEQQMEHMTPAEMAALSAQVGMPVTKDMLSTAKERMSNLTPDQLEAMAKMAQAGGVPAANGSAMPGMKPEDVKKMADAVASNPDMMRQASEMIASMTPEQLEAMAKSTGTPVEMAKMAAQQMKNMDPEQLQRMARMASGAAASSSAPAAAAPAGTRSVSAKSTDSKTSDVVAPMPIPDLSNMPPMEGPNGMTITPEMANMVSKMMADMTPEQMSEMTKAAMSMGSMFQGGAAGPGAAGMDSMPNISPEMIAQLSRPEMMDQVMGMMRSMDKDTLVKMLISNGMCSNEETAKQMADQMQSMSDTQMKLMVRAASTLQRTMQAAQSVKQYFFTNKLMLVALVLLLLAVLLRVLGIM